MKQRQPPVDPGDRITIDIDNQSHTGDGVGKVNGFTVFVPSALPGERVRVQVQKVKKTYAHARVEEWEETSPDRVDPFCPIFEQCGGCQLQHLAYPAQLRMKERQVADSFSRIAGMEGVKVLPVMGMEQPWHYRNKAQVPFSGRRGETVAGFYAAGTHEIVPYESCFIQQETNDQTIQAVIDIVRELDIPPYEERLHRGLLRHVMVRTGKRTKEVMVVLVTNGPRLPRKRELLTRLEKRVPGLASVVQNIHPRRSNTVLGKENRVLWGKGWIEDAIGPVRFRISPHSFFQVNPDQTVVLYEEVRRRAALTGGETVVDAYCGIGTIGLYLARDAGRVLGVESVEQAVEDARLNAELNGIIHASFEVGAAEEIMPRWADEGIRPDVIVVDPPRKGCAPELLEAAVRMEPERLIYVSCNPATLARDAAILADQGYVTNEVQPVDLFPHTHHVECVAAFTREEGSSIPDGS
ncbi:23S rRNA (uracil(1939)-C(5))-methyltransferase RlmD [Desmospora profundinema]|uniref:23S rRNA (Uracil1939-C5)-methyltransferase n=1 Tax=Desmospora profundinema TaxID=1571184 RepID=A0ABU1ILY5_9BACL|nr:23S rRNA (uracil(1939)-C(5))-methyltransferase RlmD [Desmospora profundinema]MDR6225791.1 23S rRNA (uracil1939-C5)-methyltransferase [Desmospora profundinema]